MPRHVRLPQAGRQHSADRAADLCPGEQAVIHPVRPWFWLALLFAACQWLAPSAIAPLSTAHASVAGVTCSANITSITFGNVDPSTYSDFIFGGNGNSNL